MRLIVPYITFGTLKIIYSLFLSDSHSHGDGLPELLYDTFVVGGAYWFVYCMFFIYIIAMLFWGKDEADSKKRIKAAVVIGAILVVFNSINIDLNLGLFPETINFNGADLKSPLFQIERILMYLPYFLFGFVIQHYKDRFRDFLLKKRVLLSVISSVLTLGLTCLLAMDIVDKGYAVKMLLAFSLMFLLRLAVMQLPQNLKLMKTMSKYSIQIMLFDSFYRVILFAVISRFITPSLLIALVITAVVVLLACISCIIIEKIPYIKVLFGL